MLKDNQLELAIALAVFFTSGGDLVIKVIFIQLLQTPLGGYFLFGKYCNVY